MTKELFIETINIIKKQYDIDYDRAENLGKVFTNAFTVNLIPDNILDIQLIKILKAETDDTDWIEYFIYELDFGEKYEDGSITENGKNIKLKTPEDLWELLNK